MNSLAICQELTRPGLAICPVQINKRPSGLDPSTRPHCSIYYLVADVMNNSSASGFHVRVDPSWSRMRQALPLAYSTQIIHLSSPGASQHDQTTLSLSPVPNTRHGQPVPPAQPNSPGIRLSLPPRSVWSACPHLELHGHGDACGCGCGRELGWSWRPPRVPHFRERAAATGARKRDGEVCRSVQPTPAPLRAISSGPVRRVEPSTAE